MEHTRHDGARASPHAHFCKLSKFSMASAQMRRQERSSARAMVPQQSPGTYTRATRSHSWTGCHRCLCASRADMCTEVDMPHIECGMPLDHAGLKDHGMYEVFPVFRARAPCAQVKALPCSCVHRCALVRAQGSCSTTQMQMGGKRRPKRR